VHLSVVPPGLIGKKCAVVSAHSVAVLKAVPITETTYVSDRVRLFVFRKHINILNFVHVELLKSLLVIAKSYLEEEGISLGEWGVWGVEHERQVRLFEDVDLDVLFLVNPTSHPNFGDLLFWASNVADLVVAIGPREFDLADEMGAYCVIGLGWYKLARSLGVGTMALDPFHDYAIWVGKKGPDLITPRLITLEDLSRIVSKLESAGMKTFPISGALVRGYALWDVDVVVNTTDCWAALRILEDEVPTDVICKNLVVARNKYGIGWRRKKFRYITEDEMKSYASAFAVL